MCVLGAPLLARAEPPVTPKTETKKNDALTDVARELYDQGLAAYQKDDFEKAYASFLGAWRLKKHWQIAVNLGASTKKLGKFREAAEYLSYYLREAPADDDRATRKEAEETLAAAKSHIGEVSVTVDEAGADVRVDGVSVGSSPLADPLFLEPGKHTIAARRGGDGAEVEAVVVATAGKSQAVALSMANVNRPGERSMVPPIIAFGAGGAGLVLGAIAGGVAAAQFNDLKKTCGDELVCPRSARGQFDAGNTMAGVSTAGFVVAGLGAAVGVTLLLLPAKTTKSARLGVTLGPSFVGVKGAF